MVTEIQEDIPYCCLGTSSGKQKKARSASQPPFRSENTPATIEADQILLALQQLASNSNSANINTNMNKTSKLPKSLTTTMPTFNGESESLNCLKICTKLVQKSRISSQKKTKYTISTLLCVVMRCRRSKTSAAGSERI